MGRAGGRSHITNEAFQALPQEFLQWLRLFVDTALTEQIAPAGWCVGHIYPIAKAAGVLGIENARPITLLEHGRKLLEVVATKRLHHLLDPVVEMGDATVRPTLDDDQWGFRNRRSTAAPIVLLRSLRELYPGKADEHLYHAFVDLTRAFDSVEPWSVEISLRRLGCPDNVVHLLRELGQRNSAAVITPWGTTDLFPVERGTPQGGCGAPCCSLSGWTPT